MVQILILKKKPFYENYWDLFVDDLYLSLLIRFSKIKKKNSDVSSGVSSQKNESWSFLPDNAKEEWKIVFKRRYKKENERQIFLSFLLSSICVDR